MSILQILRIPDERLRKISIPVKEIDNKVHQIINDMFDTMYAEDGIGLAAVQVNIFKCIIVIDISRNRKKRLVLINPKLIKKSGEILIEEGCLSIPGQRAFVSRAEKIQVDALDLNGNVFRLKADGLLAICIQHEMDHLIGKLFIDYLPPKKQDFINKKAKELNILKKHIFFKKIEEY